MQNLYDVGAFLDAVVDQDWCMHELTDARTASHRTADVRKVSQETDVVENSVAEPLRGRREVDPGVIEDVLEIG
jgi:hypothetical protein